MGSGDARAKRKADVGHYDAQYGNFATTLYQDVRRETFGKDIGQNGWHTAAEQDRFIRWLALSANSRALDVACGSGGPSLRLARITGCEVIGVDIHDDGIQQGRTMARAEGLAERVTFQAADAGEPLPFEANFFDAVICIDAINHLPDRPRILAEWKRLLKPGGKLLFTDPIIVTGPLTNVEIETRGSIGFFLFVPEGLDQRLLASSGFRLLEQRDATANVAEVAGRWHDARSRREKALREVEGDDDFDGQQEFLRVAERVAREGRLSRFAFLAEKTPE